MVFSLDEYVLRLFFTFGAVHSFPGLAQVQRGPVSRVLWRTLQTEGRGYSLSS